MVGAADWSRNGAETDTEQFAAEAQLKFTQQSDPDNLLKFPRHFIPVFVLHHFCKSERSKPFVLPDPERIARIKREFIAQKKLTSACPSWKLVSKTAEVLDDETFIIFNTKTKKFEKFHWSECFKYEDPYSKFFEKFTMKEFTREGWKFQKFEKLQRVDQGILKGMWSSAYKIYDAMQIRDKESTDILRLKRSDVWELRKALFLMTFLRNKDRNTHFLGSSEIMGEAREKRNTFMGVHSLSHPRDLWLHNAAIILDTPHHQVAYHKMLFDLDQEDYRTNARERFLVFWEAGPNDEFIMTDNSFGGMEVGNLEAKHTMPKKLKPSDLQKRLYCRDFMWHQIFVLSPKLAVALCHGTMVNSALTRDHRDRFGLRLSLLDKLPHPVPQGYYKDMHMKEVRFLKPEWKIPGEVEELFGRQADKGKFVANLEQKADSQLEFMVSTLSNAQVALVNMVLLQNQSITTSVENIVYRNPAALYRAIDEYSKHEWNIFTDEKQHSYSSLKRKIFNQFNKRAGGDDSGKSSSGSSNPDTRSSESSRSRRSEKAKRVVIEEQPKPAPAPPKPVAAPVAAPAPAPAPLKREPVRNGENDFFRQSDSESSDHEDSEDDDDMAFGHPPTSNATSPPQHSPVMVKVDPLPQKEEPVKPLELPAKVETAPPKAAPPAPVATKTEAPAAPAPAPPAANGTVQPDNPELEKLLKAMAEKEKILKEEQETIERLRRQRQLLEQEIESARMEKQRSEQGKAAAEKELEKPPRSRSENRDRDDPRSRATSTKSAGDKRRPRGDERGDTGDAVVDVNVAKQLALLEMEREKVRREKAELEALQQRQQREKEKSNQKRMEKMHKVVAQLERQLEEEKHEKEMVKRMAAKEKELLKTHAEELARQTRELREAQERDQAKAEVERAARAEKEKLEKFEKEKLREIEKAREREIKKLRDRDRLMQEKAEAERLQREREMQLEKDKEAERTRRHREREAERNARASRKRHNRFDVPDSRSDLSDEIDPQALFSMNRKMLGALSPTSDPGTPSHLYADEMTPPSSSHSHPDTYEDLHRFKGHHAQMPQIPHAQMRSQSPPSPRLAAAYNHYPPSPRRADTSPRPHPRRADTSPIPLPGHRRPAPQRLQLEYGLESPPSSGFQTSPESPNPPLDLSLYTAPREKSHGRRGKAEAHHPHSRESHSREAHAQNAHAPQHGGRQSQPQVRRFEPPGPLPNFNELDHRVSMNYNNIPSHLPRGGDDFMNRIPTTIDKFPVDDDDDEDDYTAEYERIKQRYANARPQKKKLQIEAGPPLGAPPPQHHAHGHHHAGRQKPPPRALPPADYRNGR